MQLLTVRSNTVSGVLYDPAKKTLVVQFKNGGVYKYFKVSEVLYARFIAAQPHPWTECGQEIKNHDFEKLFESAKARAAAKEKEKAKPVFSEEITVKTPEKITIQLEVFVTVKEVAPERARGSGSERRRNPLDVLIRPRAEVDE